MRVHEVMTRGVECVAPNSTLTEAARKMRDLDVGTMPVCDKDRLAGMITDRDITIRAVADGRTGETSVSEAMTPDVLWCFEDQDVAEASDIMKDNQVRRLLVLNRAKRLVGIVSLGDLAVEARDDEMTGATLEAVSEPAEPRR